MLFAPGQTIGDHTILTVLRRRESTVTCTGRSAGGEVVLIKIFSEGVVDQGSLDGIRTAAAELSGAGSHHLVTPFETAFASAAGRTHAYLVRPFVDDPSLQEVLTETPVLSLRELVRLARDLFDALADVHARGLAVQNLKPTNIFWRLSKPLLITDAGFWIEEESDARALQFYSPEQQTRGQGDPLSDLYSAGVILYRAMVGTLPFPPGPSANLLAQKMSGSTVSIPSGPPCLIQLLMRLMAADPSRRPASAGVARAAIDSDVAALLTGPAR